MIFWDGDVHVTWGNFRFFFWVGVVGNFCFGGASLGVERAKFWDPSSSHLVWVGFHDKGIQVLLWGFKAENSHINESEHLD